MKQKDIVVIVLVAGVGAILSYFIANKVFVTQDDRQVEVEVIDVLTSEFTTPDERFFNAESINPARDAKLDQTNQTPFNGSGQ